MDFPSYTHHICLVSEQTLPNYLGAIIPGAVPKKVHLVVTKRMKERADILQKALENCGRKVQQYFIADSQPKDVTQALKSIYHETGKDVAINVTGGTKVMALAAVEWAGIQEKPPFLFYVDTARYKILQIGGEAEQYEMKTKIKLKELLKVGANVNIGDQKYGALNTKTRDCLDNLIHVFLKEPNSLSLFNNRAKDAEERLYTNWPSNASPAFQQAVKIAQEAGKLHVSSGKIQYTSKEARFWCNGGWLEEFVQTRLFFLQAHGILDDWASNIQITSEQNINKDKRLTSDPNNELDAAFTAKNRFFIIECKTANLERTKDFSNIIYKLDSLRRNLGGVFSHGMIVSIHYPGPKVIQRCERNNINLTYGADVLKLDEKIKSWIQNAHS